MTTVVGVALIGAGPWGATLARTFSHLPGVDLRWICDLDGSRRAEVGAAHPGARLAATVDEVLDDPAVTAAIVAVDPPRHHTVGLRFLSADRHLLVEKPLALSVADAAALNREADARNRVLTVGHLLLHHPAVRQARRLIARGVLGEPLYFRATRTALGTNRRKDSAWWTLAPHDVSLAVYLFGAVPGRVSATACRHGDANQDIAAFATLSFADGRLAHIHVARSAPEGQRCFSVVGSERSLTFDELNVERPLRLVEHVRGDARPASRPLVFEPRNALHDQCRHFVSCVGQGDVSGGNGEHALAVVRVLEAGARSMRAGGNPVEVA